MTDIKEIKKEKCSVKGCRKKADATKDTKPYCNNCFNKVKFRQTRFEYWDS